MAIADWVGMTRPSLAIAAALTLVLLGGSARDAFADEPPPSPMPFRTTPSPLPRSTVSEWYGWQTLTVDGASLATTFSGAVTPALAVVGLGGLVLGAPIVHLAHERPLAALGSLGLRTLLPLTGMVTGYAAAGRCTKQPQPGDMLGPCFLHGVGEAALGGAIALGVGIAIDTTLLARETREPEDETSGSTTNLPTNLRVRSVAPSFDPTTRAASVGVGGTF